MTETEKQEILDSAKKYFKKNIIDSHIENVRNLNYKDFKINPFLQLYLAKFAFGDTSSLSQAKALVYPRVLGTSITTTFGNAIQGFCHNVLPSYASTTSGIDIEFIDAFDKKRKYCQLKAGPQTINKDDVEPILNTFKSVKNLARTNGLRIPDDDFIIGVIYGTPEQLSHNYKKIAKEYSVYIGQDFWCHLTGDDTFYYDLIDTMTDLVNEVGATGILDETIERIAKEIKIK